MAEIDEVLEDLAERIAGIAAELDDLGFEQLRAAARDGNSADLAAERRLLKARRALDRAVAALRLGSPDENLDI